MFYHVTVLLALYRAIERLTDRAVNREITANEYDAEYKRISDLRGVFQRMAW